MGLMVAAAVFGLAGLGLSPRTPRAALARTREPRPQPAAVVQPDRTFGLAPSIDPDLPLAGEVSRRVLALYDGSETVDDGDAPAGKRATPVSSETALAHRLAELPLNHLGLAVDYWDVDGGALPPDRVMARYRGVLSWFGDNRLRRPDDYLRWLLRQLAARRRVVVMEGLGAYEDLQGRAASRELVDAVVRALGAQPLPGESEDSSQIRVVTVDRAMVGFEAPLPQKLEYYQHFVALPGSKSYLQLEMTEDAASVSDVIWTSGAGGFVLPSAAKREDRIADRWVTRWLIDPFRFFAAAFALDGLPRVDFTTLNGDRIFYSQIDGDGMDTLSELDYTSRCGEIIRDQILRRYQLPFTASVVVGFTAPPPVGKGTPADAAVARSIFALDNVEVGSHGFAHPLDWRDPTGEVSVPELPGYRMSSEWEIARSTEYINRELAPPNKPCRIMLWTGACNPSDEQLATAYRLGLRNLNGGDPRMDAHFPSYAHLQPPVHLVGGQPQFFTSAANDYILTDEWKPPYYRFRNVLQTFARSGAPRRVVPVDVYFHFYSARNITALTALREVLDWAARQPLAPLFASEYVDVVHDAQSARLARLGDGRWLVRKGPSLRTVRFDDPHLLVDVARSRGVLGFVQEPALGATYVHLDDSREAVIALGTAAAPTPYLERASGWVDRLRARPDAIEWTTHGPGRRRVVFAGLAPHQRWRIGGAEAIVDGDGRLTLAPAGGAGITQLRATRVAP